MPIGHEVSEGSPALRNNARRDFLLLSVFSIALVAPVLAANPQSDTEWRSLGNGADAQHNSGLTQINDHTVSRLGLAWSVDMPSADGLVGNPLVADGVVYQSGPRGRVYANDVRTGNPAWTFDPHEKFDSTGSLVTFWARHLNRGVALLDDRLFVASGNCHLYALDRKTGKLVWDSVSCDPKQTYGITAAPRVGAGLVFIGNTCGESASNRGYVDAFVAATGQRKWRFYTVPGDPTKGFESDLYKKAAATWGTDWYSKSHGCGSVWDAITYDAELNQLYIGVGSPAPFNPQQRAADAGDELFSGSIVTLDASTGKYLWHFKVVPHDGLAMHPAVHMMTANLTIGGRLRRVVMTAPKNGFFYVLDAKTGAFISGKDYLPQNWALGLDAKTGRPVTNPATEYWKHPDTPIVTSPGPIGRHNWQAMAFNPSTGLVYIPAIDAPSLVTADPQAAVGGILFDSYYGLRKDAKWTAAGYLVAWDPVKQKMKWQVKQTNAINGGVLSTAGNLVFQGEANGLFSAYSADRGKVLWTFDTKEAIIAAPSTVMLEDVQYILVPVGNAASAALGIYARLASTPATRGPSRLLAFKLDAKATVASFTVRSLPKPSVEPQSQAFADEGGKNFERFGCDSCHGPDAVSAGGTIKDLRFMTRETFQQMPAIVIGGARSHKGMPAFPEMTVAQLQAIQAYVVKRAWDDYDLQENSIPPAQARK